MLRYIYSLQYRPTDRPPYSTIYYAILHYTILYCIFVTTAKAIAADQIANTISIMH